MPKLVFLTAPAGSLDESILLVYPELISDGKLPNRDFFTVYGPGTYALLAAVYALTGPSLLAERVVALSVQLFIVLGVMALARRHGAIPSTVAGALSALVLTGPALLAIAWNDALALMVWSLVLLGRHPPYAALAGVLAGLSTWFRFEAVLLCVAALPLIWRRPRAKPYVLGMLLGVVPTASHLAIAGRSVVENVVFQRMGLNGQRDLSLLTPGTVALLAMLVAAVTFLCIVAVRRRHEPLEASAALLSVGMLPQALQRVDYGHVAAVACVVLPLAAARASALVPAIWRIAIPHRRLSVGGAVAALTISLAAVYASVDPSGTAVTHRGRTTYVAPSQVQPLTRYLDSVTANVPPGSRLFVGANDMSGPVANLIFLYHLLPEYQVDAYYIEIPDGVANVRGARLVRDIEEAEALILTDPPADLLLVTPRSGRGVDEANAAVRAGFCTVESLPDGRLMLPLGSCTKD